MNKGNEDRAKARALQRAKAVEKAMEKDAGRFSKKVDRLFFKELKKRWYKMQLSFEPWNKNYKHLMTKSSKVTTDKKC
jgi:hypothetical protein